MFTAKFDTRQFSKTMKNSLAYSMGFVDGVEMSQIKFNRELGEFTKQALFKYIDAKARANHDALHHVYEPGMTGTKGGRLFDFNVSATKSIISFKGHFLPSSVIPLNGGHVFTDRANIMENGISVTIAPKNSDVLAFQYNGEMVFTRKTIFIAHPGGDGVAGSFGETIDDFFANYFTNALLSPLMMKLQTADEFTRNFSSGASGGGYGVGMRAGQAYLDVIGEIE